MLVELLLTLIIMILWFLGGWSITGFIEHGNQQKMTYNQGLFVYAIWPFIPIKTFFLGALGK